MTHSFPCVNPPSEQWTNEAIQMSVSHVIYPYGTLLAIPAIHHMSA